MRRPAPLDVPSQDIGGFAGFPSAIGRFPATGSMDGASVKGIAHRYDRLAREVLVHSAECPDAPLIFEKASPSFPQTRTIYDQQKNREAGNILAGGSGSRSARRTCRLGRAEQVAAKSHRRRVA